MGMSKADFDAVRGVSTGVPARIVRLPISSGAAYPFAEAGYSIRVIDGDRRVHEFPGKISRIYFGFTDRHRQDFDANNNIPWVNSAGAPVAEGYFDIVYRHNGGYKGSMLMQDRGGAPLEVKIPAGMHLVYRIEFDRFAGDQYSSGSSRLLERTQTDVFYIDE